MIKKNSTEKILPLHFHKKQSEIFFCDALVIIVTKGRRFGLTTGGAKYFIKCAVEGNKKRMLWIDVNHSTLERNVERYFLPLLSNYPRNRWIWRQTRKELQIKNENEWVIIDFRSADTPDSIEGHAYDLVFINEAGWVLYDNPSLWHGSIMPMTLDYRDAQIIAGGTPKGRGFFFQLAQLAKTTPGWKYFHFTSYDNPFNSKAEIDRLKEQTPERFREQEYEGAFMDDGGGVFRNVKDCVKGQLQPPHPNKTYRAGVDLARKRDYTVVAVLDNHDHLCAFLRMGNKDWHIQKEEIAKLLKKYQASALIDSTGLGDPILSDLQDMGLDAEGFQFTQKSKVQIIDRLSLAIEQGNITFPDIPELVTELEVYQYDITTTNVRYNAPSGFNDDCVVALALAYQGAVRKPFKYTYHYADKRRREKSMFDMEREYEKTGTWTRYY